MVGTLHQMIANHPSAHTTAAQNVVTGMQKSRLTIDHLKPNVEKPVRDSGDELGLVKSRLFLDAMTQQGLHSAIDIYERSLGVRRQPGRPRAPSCKRISASCATRLGRQYGEKAHRPRASPIFSRWRRAMTPSGR
ncbi:hypothetical protein IE994_23265 [Enterobacter hormaechei]|nr:hypothetical protein [Enterobacter hormaechei]